LQRCRRRLFQLGRLDGLGRVAVGYRAGGCCTGRALVSRRACILSGDGSGGVVTYGRSRRGRASGSEPGHGDVGGVMRWNRLAGRWSNGGRCGCRLRRRSLPGSLGPRHCGSRAGHGRRPLSRRKSLTVEMQRESAGWKARSRTNVSRRNRLKKARLLRESGQGEFRLRSRKAWEGKPLPRSTGIRSRQVYGV
jgi:hypothetical protein